MSEALLAMNEKEALKESERKASMSVKIRIATPGVKAPGTPRHTPKRFGL